MPITRLSSWRRFQPMLRRNLGGTDYVSTLPQEDEALPCVRINLISTFMCPISKDAAP